MVVGRGRGGLRILRWGDFPGSYPGGPSILTVVLKKREAGESESGKEKEVKQEDLKMLCRWPGR